ncbi:MAG: NAD(P)H-hydrate epimerase [Acidobacteria bacterium]|nr:NAD(P)H-hydrate epimerase [Acidobacteriota bacterium]
MREIDRIAVEETGPNLFQMMENAGRNLALQAIEVLGPDWRERHVLVLAGAGGNGGGGICAARHLANRGAAVTLVLAAPLPAGGVPAFQYHVYTGTPGRQIDAAAVREERPDLLIDALMGYGLTTAPQGIAADLITWANGTGAPILSLDVPSGVDATTGDIPGVVIRPRWTMTLALPKTGLRPEHAGQLVLADIGIPAEAFRRAGLAFVRPFGDRFRIPLTIS